MLNSFKELCIMRMAVVNFFARVLNPRGGAYILSSTDTVSFYCNSLFVHGRVGVSIWRCLCVCAYIYMYVCMRERERELDISLCHDKLERWLKIWKARIKCEFDENVFFFMSMINWHLWCCVLVNRSHAILSAQNLSGPYLEVGINCPCIYSGEISCEGGVI